MNAQAQDIMGCFVDDIATRVADKLWERYCLTMGNNQPEKADDNLLCGWNAIAGFLGTSVSTAIRLRAKFGDAIWQQVNNGKVYADKVQIKNKWQTICTSKN